MAFVKSAVKPANNTDQAYYFCFLDEDILIEKSSGNEMFPLLTIEGAKAFGFQGECFFGLFNEKPCYSVVKLDKNVPHEYQWVHLRSLYLSDENGFYDVAGYAKQICDWNRNFRFCGRCASETIVLENEHARICKKCQLVNYPRISPAIITAIIKDDDRILLARGLNFQDNEMFSVLAGFLDPGESLEECVKREVFEEVGITVTNVRYFKSQSWPFPDSLMIGFTADYQSGDIKIDANEIVEAGWFKADALPKVPHRRSISSELIQWFGNKNT